MSPSFPLEIVSPSLGCVWPYYDIFIYGQRQVQRVRSNSPGMQKCLESSKEYWLFIDWLTTLSNLQQEKPITETTIRNNIHQTNSKGDSCHWFPRVFSLFTYKVIKRPVARFEYSVRIIYLARHLAKYVIQTKYLEEHQARMIASFFPVIQLSDEARKWHLLAPTAPRSI